jgi:hypothetical protein
MLMLMDTFEKPIQNEDKEPSGYPFEDEELDEDSSEVDRGDYASKLFSELYHNLIYHKADLIEALEIPVEKGNLFFDKLWDLGKEYRKRFDINLISYSFCSKGIEDDTIYNVIDGTML